MADWSNNAAAVPPVAGISCCTAAVVEDAFDVCFSFEGAAYVVPVYTWVLTLVQVQA